MIYLLDVNALVALGLMHHEFHDRVAAWVEAESPATLATCSITELGFVRVLAEAQAYGVTVAQARSLLLRLKRVGSSRFTFIVDQHDVSHLPSWVKTPKRITDGHLSRLASANDGVLATLDGSIPGSLVIPKKAS